MYSVVLMAALTGGTSDTAWCLRSYGCHGCHGCHCGCACGWCGCGGWCGHGGYCAHFAAYPPIGNGYSFCDFCGCYAGYGNGSYRGYGNGYGLGYANGYGLGHGNGYWCNGCYCGCFNSIGCYCGHSCWGVPPRIVAPPLAHLPPPQTKQKNGRTAGEHTARAAL